jgi:16S rRNA U516 pseudouridylate synthase RsuA-like enzyme
MGSRISINGQVYHSNAGNITMTNNKIIIDGKDVTPSEKEIYIIINGSVNTTSGDIIN